MKPLILDMQAFGPYAGKQHLDFADLKGRKFFLIHGATGAGKTSILDAICYALYGSAASDLREAKALRSDHASPDLLTMVTFVFGLGDDVYKVQRLPRQLRPRKRGGEGFTEQQPEAALWQLSNGNEALLEAKYENVTRKIIDLLGFQCHQFRQVVLLPQGEFRKLLVAKSDERQQIMQTLFKTELYERIEAYLKQKAKDKSAEIKQIYEQKNWHLAESGLASLTQVAEAVADLTKAAAVSQDNLTAVNERYQQAHQQLSRARELDRQFTEYGAAQAAWQAQLAKEPDYTALAQHVALLEKAAKLAEAEKNVKRLQAEVQQRQDQEVQQKAVVVAAQAADKKAEGQFNEANSREPECRQDDRELAQLAKYQEQARLLQESVDGLAAKQAAAADAEHQVAVTDEKMAKLKAQLAELTNRQQMAFSSAALLNNYQLQIAAADSIIKRRQLLLETAAAEAKLAKQLKGAEVALASVTEKRDGLRQELDKAKQLVLIGQAGLLAQHLRDGTPCPVCGSLEHPQLASVLAALPSGAALEALQAQLAQLDKQREQTLQLVSAKQNELTMKARQVADLLEELGDDAAAPLPAMQENAAQLRRSYEQSKLDSEQLSALEDKLTRYKESEERGLVAQKTVQEARQRALGELESWQAVVKEREQLLPIEYRTAGALNKRISVLTDKMAAFKAELQRTQRAWQTAKEQTAAAVAALENIQKNMRQSEQLFLREKFLFYKMVKAAGFADFGAYVGLKAELADIPRLSEAVQNFNKDLAVAVEHTERLAKLVAGKTPPDMAALQQQCAALGEAQQTAIADKAKLALELAKHKQVFQKVTALEERLLKMQTENGVLAKLYQVTRGDNKYAMNLQRFVLSSLLDRVTEAANVMLKTMSKSRYLLQRTSDVARKGSASGLDLEVFDNNTGAARGVATLSGGETFLASLALALGLADVVQQYAGGIRLDTIFVDEGFGTLDPESLDMALNTLIALQHSGRLVGIISHVPELQERIDARLEVKVGKQGSSAEFHVG